MITVNMQACNDLNWRLLVNRNDPGHQLEWLEQELDKIEKTEGGYAYLLAHIPASMCLS